MSFSEIRIIGNFEISFVNNTLIIKAMNSAETLKLQNIQNERESENEIQTQTQTQTH